MHAVLSMANETTIEEPRSPEAGAQPPKAGEPVEAREVRQGALEIVRRHPALTVIGAAGVSLFGGLEVAAGVLLGAGVVAMLRPKRRVIEAVVPVEPEAHEPVRDLLTHARQRMRAVAHAAFGDLEPR